MSCPTMLPSSFVQHGLNADKIQEGNHSANDETVSRAAAAASLMGAAQRMPGTMMPSSGGTNNADLALLESMIAQEQQRRRAILLATSSSFSHGGGSTAPLSSTGGNSAVAAFLSAERQRALLFEAGLHGGFSGLERDILSMNRLGLGLFGGLGSSFHSFPPNAGAGTHAHAGGLVGGGGTAGAGVLSGRGDTLSMMSNPAMLVAAHQQQQQQQHQRNHIATQSSIANDQLILDAMEQGGRKGRTGTFPQKLHQMLSDLEKEEDGSDIASYLPHGRAFAIHKPNEFVKKIMPKYFRMSRFSSFQRQLNLYEFMRITDGPDKGAYFHELFHRGRPVLASQIRRNKIKGDSNTTAVKRDRLPLIAGDTTAHGVSSLLSGATRLTGVPESIARTMGGHEGLLASRLAQSSTASNDSAARKGHAKQKTKRGSSSSSSSKSNNSNNNVEDEDDEV